MNKRFFLPSFMFLCAALCCAMLFISCDFGTTEDDSEVPISKFLSVKVTRCERVGAVLVVEFDVNNKSGRDIQELSFHENGAQDNVGGKYSNFYCGIVGGTSMSYYQSISLVKGESKKCLVKIPDFDTSNTASKVTLRLMFDTKALNDKNITNWAIETSSSVSDNRLMNHGIQTCDTGLTWTVKSIRRMDDGSLHIAETVTNNTGKDLKDVQMHENGAIDDMGRKYGNFYMAIEGSDMYSYYIKFDLDNGASKTVVTRIPDFDTSGNARTVSLNSMIQSQNYLFSDDTVRLINGSIVISKSIY